MFTRGRALLKHDAAEWIGQVMKHWKSPDHFFEDRNVGEEMNRLLDELGFETASVTAASAKRIAGIHEVWGKGIHPASLNFGDCFA